MVIKELTKEYKLDNLQVKEPNYRQEYAIRSINTKSNLKDMISKKNNNTKLIEKIAYDYINDNY